MTGPATSDLRVGLLTREFPPDVYGGAGAHVDFLVRELRHLVDVDVHCRAHPATTPPRTPRTTPAGRRQRRRAGALD